MGAVAYLNNQGGIKSWSLSLIAANLFLWVEMQLLSLVEFHVKGVYNTVADSLSRIVPSCQEMSLTIPIFHLICKKFATFPRPVCFEAQYSATSLQAKEGGGGVLGSGCVDISMARKLVYLFSLITLIPQLLPRLLSEKRDLVIMVQFWPFLILKSMSTQNHWLIPLFPSPLRSPKILLSPRLQLWTWRLRGGSCQAEVCRTV